MMSIASERIERLFELAEERHEEGRDELSDRYIEIALEISETCQQTVPDDLKRRFCSTCQSYLVPGENCRVRKSSKSGRVIQTCGECGSIQKF